MTIGDKLVRGMLIIVGLFFLFAGLNSIFFMPLNTLLECQSPQGNCKVEEQYIFYYQSHKFNIKDIFLKELATVGGKYGRTYHLLLVTPNFGFSTGKYSTKLEAQKMLAVVEDFQSNPTRKSLYINKNGYIDHISMCIVYLLYAILLCWSGIFYVRIKNQKKFQITLLGIPISLNRP